MKGLNKALSVSAVLLSTSLVLTACGTGDDKTTTGVATVEKDGVLTIGTLLPQTGDLSYLNPPEIAGVRLAVKEVNKAGGVLGKDVSLTSADSGDGTPDIASQSVDKLMAKDVDVVLGAASSSVSRSVIDKITDAGLVQFSPANTSPSLDDPEIDKHGMFFRTAPSDELQGAVLSNAIIADNKRNVAILARQDAYGELLADELAKGLEAGGAKVAAKVLYNADATNYTAEITEVAAVKPDAVVLVAFEETQNIIPTMIAKGIGPKKQQIYFVDGNLSNTYGEPAKDDDGKVVAKGLKPGTLAGVKGTTPGVAAEGNFKKRMDKLDPTLKDYTYGAEAYDATMIISLAAIAAKSDSPTDFSKEIIKVTRDGEACTTFKQCADLLADGKDIDYNGVSGPIELGETGSPTKASIGVYRYGKDNTYKPIKFIQGSVE